MTERILPAGFESLERFVADWALTTERERHYKRVETPLPEIRVFFDAVMARIHDMVAHLNTFPGADPDDLPPAERRLFNLALSFMEASHPMDLNWQRSDIDDAFPFERMEYLAPIDQR